jgi:type I restriction enzyme R subunit
VIVDEAHSSTSGEAMKDLKKVLADGSGQSVLATADQDADALTVAEVAEAKAEADAVDAADVIAASMTARGKQANLAFFAFTATPKPKTLGWPQPPDAGIDAAGARRAGAVRHRDLLDPGPVTTS